MATTSNKEQDNRIEQSAIALLAHAMYGASQHIDATALASQIAMSDGTPPTGGARIDSGEALVSLLLAASVIIQSDRLTWEAAASVLKLQSHQLADNRAAGPYILRSAGVMLAKILAKVPPE